MAAGRYYQVPGLSPDTVQAFAAAGIPLVDPATLQAAPYKAPVDYLVGQLLQLMLATQVPVKLPSYTAPTLRSDPIEWGVDVQFLGGGPGLGFHQEQSWGVRWTPTTDSNRPAFSNQGNGPTVPEPFPAGYVGVVWAEATAYTFNSAGEATFIAPRQCRWSWLRNGGAVNGFLRQFCSGTVEKAIAAPAFLNGLAVRHVPGAPVILGQGDTMETVAVLDDIPVNVSPGFHFRVYGYRFPAADFSRELRAMLVP